MISISLWISFIQAFGMIDARENEIIRIRDGDHDTKPKQSAKSMNSIKKSAFDKYLKLFYDRPSVTVSILKFVYKLTFKYIYIFCFIALCLP